MKDPIEVLGRLLYITKSKRAERVYKKMIVLHIEKHSRAATA